MPQEPGDLAVPHVPRKLQLAISVIALGLVVARVCETSFHEGIDAVGLGLLAFAGLPWLMPYFKTFSVMGVQAEVRELRSEVRDVNDAVVEAQADQLERDLPQTGVSGKPADAAAELDKLASRYIETRNSMPPGSRRTASMTQIFREMLAVAERAGSDAYEVAEGLSTHDPGRNLAALAVAYSDPKRVRVGELIDCIKRRSAQPFVQYWGLMAVRKILMQEGIAVFAPQDVTDLRELSSNIPTSGDRGRVLRSILTSLEE